MWQIKMARFMTASHQRRAGDYADKSWEEFIGLADFSRRMRLHTAASAQALLAFSAGEADAHTYGNVAVQMALDSMRTGSHVDMTLDGPTTKQWFDPWKRYLRDRGVTFYQGCIHAINGDGRPEWTDTPSMVELQATVGDEGDVEASAPWAGAFVEKSDFYVCAVPLHTAAALLSDWTKKHSNSGAPPEVERILAFNDAVEKGKGYKDMHGMQYFLDRRYRTGRGHTYFPDSPWGLSAIAQTENWDIRPTVHSGYNSIYSVDICDLDALDRSVQTVGDHWWQPVDNGGTAYPTHAPSDQSHPPPPWIAVKSTARNCDTWAIAARSWGQITERLPDLWETWQFQDLSLAGGQDIEKTAWEEGMRTLPNYVHVDWTLPTTANPGPRASRYLAPLPKQWHLRPGLVETLDEVEPLEAADEKEDEPDQDFVKAPGPSEGSQVPGLDHGLIHYRVSKLGKKTHRWVFAGSYMATHTRMTPMEGANESGRHAVTALLKHIDRHVDTASRRYNGIPYQAIRDYPRRFSPEEIEPKALRSLRKIDASLFRAGLPHPFDILKVDAWMQLQSLQSDLFNHGDGDTLNGVENGAELATKVETEVQRMVDDAKEAMGADERKIMEAHEILYRRWLEETTRHGRDGSAKES
jgi:hypothetical protein